MMDQESVWNMFQLACVVDTDNNTVESKNIELERALETLHSLEKDKDKEEVDFFISFLY